MLRSCSDDLIEAQALEDADNALRAVNGYFVTSIENERYYEFVRELAYTQDVGNIANLTSPGYARVFKCRHTNPDGVDRALRDGFVGRIEPARLDANSLRDFVEYLWQFTFFKVAKKTVINSVSTSGPGGLQHTLLLAFVINQGASSCDRIEISEWRYSANAQSGEIERRFEALMSFEASMPAGIPILCQ